MDQGETNFSGDGSTRFVTIFHGLDVVLSSVQLTSKSATSASESVDS